MSREYDQAIEREEKMLEARIRLRTEPKRIENNLTGKCVECGGVVEPVFINNTKIYSRWCSRECRDRWSLDNE